MTDGGRDGGRGQPEQAPIVQRLTIRYAKRSKMRFASHRDVARAFERGVRKAGLPVAYSAGFSPHPKISYAGGAPTGSASEAEYLDIALSQRCEPADVGRLLNAALPDGIDVMDVVEAHGKTAAQLEASGWVVIWPGVSPAAAAAAARAFRTAPSAVVERLTSKGMRRMDARAAVASLWVDGRRGDSDLDGECAILRMIVRQVTPAVRPEDILTALRSSAAASGSAILPSAPAQVTRVWQGPLGQEPPARDLAGPPPGDPPPGGHPVRALWPAPNAGTSDLMSETDQTASLPTASAEPVPAVRTAQARVNEQLPRGALGQHADPRAREPHGRDCPNARDGATQPVRTT